MKIPEVRERLFELAEECDMPELFDLAMELYRRKSVARAPVKTVVFNDKIARSIRAFKREHPAASYKRMAEVFNVNQGRVSEALIGKRK